MDSKLLAGDGATVERACSMLVAKFALYVDHRRYADVLDLFTADGAFSRPGLSVRGREEMSAWLESRPANWVTRHICGPTVFESVAADEATSISYITVYQGEASDKPMLPVEMPAAIIEYHDRFRRTEQGWRIASRDVKPVFIKGA